MFISGGFSPGQVKREYFEEIAPLLPIFGFMAVDWWDRDFYASRVGGRLYYRPTRTSNEPGYITFRTLYESGATFEEQRDAWLRSCAGEDGRTVQSVIDTAQHHGKRLLVQLFNEQYNILDDLDAIYAYGVWSAKMAAFLWERGGEAVIWGGGMGWETPERLHAFREGLEVCRGDSAIARYGYHPYSLMDPSVWTGVNQSEGVSPSASNEEKMAALQQHPWTEQYTDAAQTRPGWLGYRMWSYPNGDGTFGFETMRGVKKLAEESPIDLIPPEGDERLPEQAGRRPFELLPLLSQAYGVPQYHALTESVKRFDDMMNSLLHEGAPDLRMTFTIANGFGWGPYNVWFDREPFDAALAYARSGPRPVTKLYPFDDQPQEPPEQPPEDPMVRVTKFWTQYREGKRPTAIDRLWNQVAHLEAVNARQQREIDTLKKRVR